MSEQEIQAQQIQRGLEPAETMLQLVDAIRQDTAGVGACISSIRFIAHTRGDIPKSVLEWLDRLAAHTDRLESKCALALTSTTPTPSAPSVSPSELDRLRETVTALTEALVICDRFINWDLPRIVPTQEVPDSAAALSEARAALARLRSPQTDVSGGRRA
jgi:hypothetical protein